MINVPREKMSARERQVDDLERIDRLRQNVDWSGYYQRRVREKLEALAKDVLEGSHASPAALWDAWTRYQAARDFARFVDEDDAMARKALGLQVGESPTDIIPP